MYRREVLHLLDTTCHLDRAAFTAKEMELLIGKLECIGQAYRPIYHLMPHMYASVAYALCHNAYHLASTSRTFFKLIQIAKKSPQYPRIPARSISPFAKQLNWHMVLPESIECPIHWLKRLQSWNASSGTTPSIYLGPLDTSCRVHMYLRKVPTHASMQAVVGASISPSSGTWN